MRGCQTRGRGWSVSPSSAYLPRGQPSCGLAHLPQTEETQGFVFALLQSESRPANRVPRDALWDNFIQLKNTDYRQGAASGNGTGKLHLFVLAFLWAVGGASISRVGEEIPNALFRLIHLTCF